MCQCVIPLIFADQELLHCEQADAGEFEQGQGKLDVRCLQLASKATESCGHVAAAGAELYGLPGML